MSCLQLYFQKTKVSPNVKHPKIIITVFDSMSHRVVRLSSPNLNYLIGFGAILLYVNAYLLVFPSSNQSAATAMCNVSSIKHCYSPNLLSCFFNLCHFSHYTCSSLFRSIPGWLRSVIQCVLARSWLKWHVCFTSSTIRPSRKRQVYKLISTAVL